MKSICIGLVFVFALGMIDVRTSQGRGVGRRANVGRANVGRANVGRVNVGRPRGIRTTGRVGGTRGGIGRGRIGGGIRVGGTPAVGRPRARIGGTGIRPARFATDGGFAHLGGVGVPAARVGGLTPRAAAVRTNFGRVNPGFRRWFTRDWIAGHPAFWRPRRWEATTYWNAVAWASLADWWGWDEAPIEYDYGSNVVYQDDVVYYDGERLATAQQFSLQAAEIAERGATEADEDADWKSLGVWAIVAGDRKDSRLILQLTVNHAKVIRGTYFNAETDASAPARGSVDTKSQRAAFTVGTDKTVYEAGIHNLTSSNEVELLAHVGGGETKRLTLIRISPDETPNATTATAETPPFHWETSPPLFGDKWYQENTKIWNPSAHQVASRPLSSWPEIAEWFGINDAPLTYDYAQEIVADTSGIYWRSRLICSATEYAAAAKSLADLGQGAELDGDEWALLGAFQLSMPGLAENGAMLKLWTSRSGLVRGAFVYPSPERAFTVVGAVNRERQRVAFVMPGGTPYVFDMGLSNLAEDSTSLLIHWPQKKQVGTYRLWRR